jgi:DNA-binding beta-propeller fold protein YncE
MEYSSMNAEICRIRNGFMFNSLSVCFQVRTSPGEEQMKKYGMALFVLSFLVLSGAALGQDSPALAVKSPISLTKVEGRMDHLGVDVKGQRLFATAFDNHTLEVIDLKTGRQIHTISDLNEPQGAFYDAANNRLFEANGGDGTVKIFDGTTFQLLQSVTLDLDADNVRYDARTKHIVVGYGGEKFLAGKVARPGGGGALAILDATGKKVGEIAMDAHPESFQLEKTGTRVFVNVPDKQEVEVADLAKGTVLTRWPVTCTTNFPMALDEAHQRLFVGCRMPARLAVFDTETGKVVASPAIVEHTDDLFFDASKGRIYILGEGFIEVWQEKDPDHYERIGRYPTPADGRTGLFVPDLEELFETIPHHGQQGAEILVYGTK